jgi:hypothetical protein
MAKYTVTAAGWTTTATAAGAIPAANNIFHALRTASSTNTARIQEVYLAGESTTSTVVRMRLARASTNSTGPTDVTPANLNPLSAAAVARGYVAVATTRPTITSNPPTLELGFNAFGGVVRWVAAPDEEVWITTTTAPNSDVVLASESGAGTVSDHIIFEEI